MKHTTPLLHAKEIIAWAQGATIEVHYEDTNEWVRCTDPLWVEGHTYRIKPYNVHLSKEAITLPASLFEELVEALEGLQGAYSDVIEQHRFYSPYLHRAEGVLEVAYNLMEEHHAANNEQQVDQWPEESVNGSSNT